LKKAKPSLADAQESHSTTAKEAASKKMRDRGKNQGVAAKKKTLLSKGEDQPNQDRGGTM